MFKYFLSFIVLTTTLSYADGMIISFQEMDEIANAEKEEVIAAAEEKKQEPEPAPTEETKPPVLEKKDFLQDHEEVPPPATDSYEKTFMQTLLVLIGLLLLIFLGIWLIRKFSGGRFRHFNAGKTIKILERRPLSHKSMLYIVDIRGKQILIAESQLEITRIGALDWISEEKEL